MNTVSITEDLSKKIAIEFRNELIEERSGQFLVMYPAAEFTFNAYISKEVSGSSAIEDNERGGGFFLNRTSYDYSYTVDHLWCEDEDCNEVTIVDQLEVIKLLTKHLN